MFSDPDFKANIDSIYLQEDLSRDEKKEFWMGKIFNFTSLLLPILE